MSASSAIHKPGSFLGSLLGLVGFSAVAGLLVSATLTPAVAVASSTANSSIDIFESLPDYVEIDQQSEINEIFGVGADGEPVQIAEFYSQNREIVDMNGAGEWAPLAVISAEDRRFFDHGGVDAPSVVRAVLGQLGLISGDSGASTLTMQLVRQQIVAQACELVDPSDPDSEFVDEEVCNDQFSDSYARKLQEMKLAIGLEARYTKGEILLAYLNIALFGEATYGIQAAAQRTFGVNAADLTISQAASLMATVQNPTSLSLFNSDNYERNQERRDWIIGRMLSEGYITQDQHDRATATPVDDNFVNIQPPQNGCGAGHDSARYFCDYVREILGHETADGSYLLGGSAEANASSLALGGLDIYTTIDVGLNDEVQGVVDQYVPNSETRWQSGGAVTLLDVGTGNVLSMAQNTDYNDTEEATATETSLNFNVDAEYGGGNGFQPGSGFKIFTLASWIEAGFSPNTSLDTSRHPRNVPTCGSAVSFDPQNNEGFSRNRATVQETYNFSMNTGVIEMATRLDVCDIMDRAESMGVSNAMGGELERYPSALIGGASNVSPMSMAEAFQTIANGGAHCEPRAIDRIVGRDGDEIAVPGPSCEQVMTAEVASVMQYVLTGVTNANPINNPNTGNPVITKTGTNDNVVQTWVNGASSTVAASVWVGNIRGQVNINNFGAWDQRSYVFTSVMQAANNHYPGGQFLPPDQETLQGNAEELPDVSGMSPEEATSTLEDAGFAVVEGDEVDGEQREGLVEYTSPGAGASVLPESSVTIFVSNGANYEAEDVPVPDLDGMSPGEASDALSEAGFDDGALDIEWRQSPRPDRCTVLEQDPSPGDDVPADSGVSVVIGSQEDGEDPDC